MLVIVNILIYGLSFVGVVAPYISTSGLVSSLEIPFNAITTTEVYTNLCTFCNGK